MGNLDRAPVSATESVGAINATSQFVTFTSSDRAYGVDIMAVREIRSWSPITEVPEAPYGSLGVLDIRGKIVQVFDLATLLGSHSRSDDTSGRVVLVVSPGKRDVGLLVDTVSDIIFIQGDQLRDAPNSEPGQGKLRNLVKVDDRLIGILDIDVLFPRDVGEAEGQPMSLVA